MGWTWENKQGPFLVATVGVGFCVEGTATPSGHSGLTCKQGAPLLECQVKGGVRALGWTWRGVQGPGHAPYRAVTGIRSQ